MKATIKNQILDYLQWSNDEYEQRLFKTIWNWCQHYGKSPSLTQQLLANAVINKWFINEYQKCELQFLKIVEVVPNNTDALRNHYKSCTIQIMMIYPQTLIDEIKNNKAFSSMFLTNIPVYYAN
jgi:hypothetical protein